MIYKIAKAELQSLFYSPIAWLILIVFTIQSSLSFAASYQMWVEYYSLGYSLDNLTAYVFTDEFSGFLPKVQQYLYLYIPLLTMGLMSREFSSGSIKLLYSSPVTNSQIILGKYLTVVVYALILIAILLSYTIFGAITIEHFDFPAIATALFGLFLLICAYGAIGLFMSSLTSYQVVAAIGTFALLAVLNMVGNLWRDIAFVRDITYWLSMRGRSNEFIRGLICSEDVLYFLIVISLFIVLSILRLNANRQKTPASKSFGKYAGIFLIAVILGYFSSRPALMFYHDSTRTKVNTLTPNSQEIVAQMKDGLTINTFVNILEENYFYGLPSWELADMKRFRQYVRFKPEIKMKYFRYYDKADNPGLDKRYPDLSDRERMIQHAKASRLDSNIFKTPEEISKIENLKPEGNRFVRTLLRDNGEKTFLRIFDDNQKFPSEREISAAFKRLVMELPQVGFVKGHGERDCIRSGDRDYNKLAQEKPFRYSLINQGFDFNEVTLDKEIPENIDILVIAEPRQLITPEEYINLDKYIARGGNLLIAGEPGRQEQINPLAARFGVEFQPGRLVKPSENFSPDFIISLPTKEGGEMMYFLQDMIRRDFVATMPGATAISYQGAKAKGFNVTELLVTDTLGGTWNELETTNFIDDTVKINPSLGEKPEASMPVAIALSREIGDKEQKVLVLSDADCISNGEISIRRKGVQAANYNLIMGAFFWMSDDEVPIDVRRPNPPDTKIFLSISGMTVTKWGYAGVLPLIMGIFYLLLWIRRKGK